MHITAVCPACQSEYQVDPSLRGKRMRCPNPICRTVFAVDGAASPVAAPPPPVETSAHRPPTPPPTPQVEAAKPTWSAPPPVRAAQSVVAPPIVDDLDIPGDDDVGRIFDPSPEQTSDSRNGAATRSSTERAEDTSHKPRASKFRKSLLILGIAGVAIAIVAGVVFQRIASQRQLAEATLAAKADELYQASDYPAAMKLYQQLQHDFPNNPDYRLLATLSELRAEVDAANDAAALADARKHTAEFLESFGDAPPFKARASELFPTLAQLVKRSLQSLQEHPNAAALAEVESAWSRYRSLAGRPIANEDREFREAFDSLRATLAERERRQQALDFIARHLPRPSAESVIEAHNLIIRLNLKDDRELAEGLRKLRGALQESIVFTKSDAKLPPAPGDAIPPIALTASLASSRSGRGAEPIVALTPSGVLYGVDPKTGAPLWVVRLGIDSHFAPLRLPDRPGLFVVSNDAKFLAHLDTATGKFLWRHDLPAPASAAPFAAGGRILVPLVTGRLEIVDPQSLQAESVQFDQPLAGGAAHPGSTLVFLAGAANCVYVLDLAKNSCVAILETDHAAGSLVGAPIVVPDGDKRTWLILPQTDPGPRIRLQAIAYTPETLLPQQKRTINGSLSTPPYHDAESIVLVTDEGKLHRIGLRLPGNTDPLLFPLTPSEKAVDAPPRGQSIRAQVVHRDAENLWILSGGRLQRLHESFSPKTGPTLKLRWAQGPWLGEAVHPAHVHTDADGTILFLTTHDPAGAATWLSAIDAETGKIIWRTQLGSAPRSEPLHLGEVVLWDDGAALFGGHVSDPVSFKALAFNGERPPRSVLMTTADGLVRVGWWPELAKLTLTAFDLNVLKLPPPREIKLSAPVAGTPLVLDGALIAPLRSGVLERIDLATAAVSSGPDWRSDEAEARLVRLGPDRFAVLRDRAVVAYEWKKTWKETGRTAAAAQRLIGAERIGDALWVWDAAGAVTMFDAETLRPIARTDWRLGGAVTAGPFVVGKNALFVIDGKRLVALDPKRDGSAWEATFLSEIAVAPRLVGDRLIVADVAGNFWALDPATGASLDVEGRPVLSLRANIAPAASPIVRPDGKLLILWSDGAAGVVAVPR